MNSASILFDAELKAAKDYWGAKMSRVALTRSRSVRPVEADRDQLARTVDFELAPDVCHGLQRLTGGSPFLIYVTLMTAFKTCLARFSGERAIVVGSPALANNGSEPLINALPIVDEIDPGRPFQDVLMQVRATLLEAYSKQQYPWDLLLEDLGLTDSPGRCPLFDVALVLTDVHGRLPAIETDLVWRFTRRGDTIVGSAEHRSGVTTDVRRFAHHMQNVLRRAVEDSRTALLEIDPLSPAERHLLFREWNVAAQTAMPRGTVHRMFEAQVARTPEAVAVASTDASLSYRQLDRRADRVARTLLGLGVTPGAPVAVAVERSSSMAVAVLAILKAGGAYLPLDLSYPHERLSFMLEDSGVRWLLTQEHLVERLPASGARPVTLEHAAQAGAGPARPAGRASCRSLAFVLYTSGSTGQPKGVAMPLGSLTNLLAWQVARDRRNAAGHPALERTLQFAPLSFDVSFQEMFSTWCGGGTLVLIAEEARRDPRVLVRQLEETSVSRLFMPFVALHQLAETAGKTGRLPALRRLITAGEQLQVSQALANFFTGLPTCRLENHYGPTESHVVTAYALPAEAASWPALPSIGTPIEGARIYVLDRRGRPLPAATSGELLIAGGQLARGYIGRPKLTAERFLPDPFTGPGARMYQTGDLVAWMPDGNIAFQGRIDFQIKIRGFRVEPGEIEVALSRSPAVQEAAVVALGEGRLKALAAYVVPAAGETPSVDRLRGFLLERMPEYMVPQSFVFLDALPLSPSGKVDRRALPSLSSSRPELTVGFAAPRGPAEEVVAGVWIELLGIDHVGIDDTFFDLGGHSLLATQVTARLSKIFRAEVPVLSLFERPTVAGLTAEIAELRGGAAVVDDVARLFQQVEQLSARQLEDLAVAHGRRSLSPTEAFELRLAELDLDGARFSAIRRRRHRGHIPLSFAQEQVWIRHQLEPDGVIYNLHLALRLGAGLDLDILERALNEIHRRHETLRTTFTSVDGTPAQIVAPYQPRKFRRVDLRPLAAEQRAIELRRRIDDEVSQPFDLETGPLLRLCTLQLGGEHVLLMTVHHIVIDGWSLWVLARELEALYGAYSHGEPSPLPELEIQYGDFVCWQREGPQQEALDQQLDYWRRQLTGAPAQLLLPTDRPRAPLPTSRGATHPFEVPAASFLRLQALCREEGATPFMGLLAAFNILLRLYTGQDDVVVGTDIANRNRGELEGLIGFFINNLALRTDLSGDPSFRHLLSRVREMTLAAYAHQDVPFFKVVEAVRPAGNRSHHPLFQVLLVLHNFDFQPQAQADSSARGRGDGDEQSSDLSMAPLPVHSGAAKFDMTLYLLPSGDSLQGLLEYNADLFDAATVTGLVNHFNNVIDQVTVNPETSVSSVFLTGEADSQSQDLILGDFNEDLSELEDA